ncbi:hypothetical protein [Streptomyces rugosispiralis]|uniref:Uncharacterized protein n=1 Tax=Streptomyces rugosispiralis TaxID=2967341 RepID=A0ABT1V6S2_9ACTN|nr:hypothetical protein [Streptomyces rugosispiralis]MCQ8193084.1 hypothetical protein [Streptomyces rugosispiralis]
MTTAGAGRDHSRGGAGRWMWFAAVALFAAFAVLLHHETNAAVSHSVRATDMGGMARMVDVPDMSGMARMVHAPPATMSAHGGGHDGTARASAPAAHGDDGSCSGMGVQHCSAAGIDVVQHMPPSEPWVGREGDVHATPAGRPVPGTVSRAPPDLSVLSRLLL